MDVNELDKATAAVRRLASKVLNSNLYGYPSFKLGMEDICTASYKSSVHICSIDCPNYKDWLLSFSDDFEELKQAVEKYQEITG